jgi:hypothetical protein
MIISRLAALLLLLTTLCVHAAVPALPALRDELPTMKDADQQSTRLNECVDVAVGKDGIQVAGKTVQTPEQLLAVLAERHILKIRLQVDAQTVGYETIGKIIYGAARAAIIIASVETRQP